MLKMLPYTMGSESGRDLAQLLSIKRVRHDGDYVPRFNHTLINWGSARDPQWMGTARSRGVRMLNNIASVNVASNKLTALTALQRGGVRIPEFTTDINVAQRWVNEGGTVMERHDLRANSGVGIRIVNQDDDNVESHLTRAPLYTKFVPKTAEFRVHVFQGRVIDYCEKKKVTTDRRPENFNRYVCSTEVGWVFVRNGIREIQSVKDVAVRALQVLGLDFGAVDVIFYGDVPYVLEVNTAPGLMGTTLLRYANAFRRYVGAPDLPESTVMPGTNTPVVTPSPAAHVAQVVRPESTSGLVTLQLDRATALRLKQLLAHVA